MTQRAYDRLLTGRDPRLESRRRHTRVVDQTQTQNQAVDNEEYKGLLSRYEGLKNQLQASLQREKDLEHQLETLKSDRQNYEINLKQQEESKIKEVETIAEGIKQTYFK